jgi:hypothetical protein
MTTTLTGGTFPQFVHTVWPEKRYVPVKQVENWFYDAVANGQISASDAKDADTFKKRCMCLHGTGIITLHEDWEETCD